MANYFECIGKIVPLKRNGKSPVARNEYDSGWMTTSVDFVCNAGKDTVFCRVQGGKWKDDKRNKIKTMSARKRNDDGTFTESKRIEIPWDNRFDKKEIANVAAYCRFIVDTGSETLRRRLNLVKNAFNNGDLNNGWIQKYQFKSEEEVTERIEEERKKKKQFLSEWDFAEYFADFLEEAGNFYYHIKGVYDIQYNAVKGRFYSTYRVTSISRVFGDITPYARFNNMSIFIGKNCLEEITEDKAIMHCWTQYYDSAQHANRFAPIEISMYGDKKKFNYFKSKTQSLDAEIGKWSFVVDIINQTEYKEITIDDIADEERAEIECGLRTFESVKRQYNNRIAGGRISELRFNSLGKGDLAPTAYKLEDMSPVVQNVAKETSTDTDIDIDVFDDDEL